MSSFQSHTAVAGAEPGWDDQETLIGLDQSVERSFLGILLGLGLGLCSWATLYLLYLLVIS